MSLQEQKKQALEAYKITKLEYQATITKENIKGDPDKWIAFCKQKSICMKLGCRI